MVKRIKLTEHLTDLEIRFKIVIPLMTPYNSREDLWAAVLEKRFGYDSDDKEFDEATAAMEKDFKSLSNGPAFSKMIRNQEAHLTARQVEWLCNALGIEVAAFLDTEIAQLIYALAESAQTFGPTYGWSEVDPEFVLNQVAALTLVDSSVDSRPGFVRTMFADIEPKIFQQTNHSEPKVMLKPVFRTNRKVLLDAVRQFTPFSSLKNPKLDLKRLQVAASSDVYYLEAPDGPYLLKLVRRLPLSELQTVQQYEAFFANARLDGESLFEDAESLRPIEIGSNGETYAIFSADQSASIGLSDRDHLLTLQRYAPERIMFGKSTIPESDIVDGSANQYLASLGRSLARLHVAARQINFENTGDIAAKSLGFFDGKMTNRIAAYDEIFHSPHEFTDIWRNPENSRVIHKAAEEYDAWYVARPSARSPVMYDLHPFNAFFDTISKRCTLIFDFEGMSSNWLEEDVLAFATHRFVREYVRAKDLSRDMGSVDEIRRLVSLIAESYVEAGGDLNDKYLDRVGSLIRITNIGKFQSLLHQLMRGVDVMNRKFGTHDAETRKFLLYLRESELFEGQIS